MSSPLPDPTEVPALIPAPRSIVWRRAGDARGLVAAGHALLLQVSHPTVGAGVHEHSNFRNDSWGRLLRTLDYVNVTVYGGPQAAAEMGRRVFEMHKRIRGRKPDGTPYHALEPDAYAWVHATLADAIVQANERFARPMSRVETEQFWHDWRRLGRVIGVREELLPQTWADFGEYVDRMVADTLERNPAVDDVLETLARPQSPPPLPDFVWLAARVPLAHAQRLATVGLLPPALREKLGLDWTAAQERELRAMGRLLRAATPLMPPQLRVMGPSYLRWRGEALATAVAA
jgi:uncharacterized protein (DUF2236 family)